LSLAQSGPVALVFGREDKGLLNEEIAQCTHLIRIPVDEGYTSINLSQAVLITCYEFFTASGRYQPPREKAPPAPQAQKMQLMKNWSAMLQEIGFMKSEQEDHFMQGFHRVFSRGVFTRDDAALLLGVARQAIWATKNASEIQKN
jgi:tRNA/rRNA methyltransferase